MTNGVPICADCVLLQPYKNTVRGQYNSTLTTDKIFLDYFTKSPSTLIVVRRYGLHNGLKKIGKGVRIFSLLADASQIEKCSIFSKHFESFDRALSFPIRRSDLIYKCSMRFVRAQIKHKQDLDVVERNN